MRIRRAILPAVLALGVAGSALTAATLASAMHYHGHHLGRVAVAPRMHYHG
jgi:hypothetical protein